MLLMWLGFPGFLHNYRSDCTTSIPCEKETDGPFGAATPELNSGDPVRGSIFMTLYGYQGIADSLRNLPTEWSDLCTHRGKNR